LLFVIYLNITHNRPYVCLEAGLGNPRLKIQACPSESLSQFESVSHTVPDLCQPILVMGSRFGFLIKYHLVHTARCLCPCTWKPPLYAAGWLISMCLSYICLVLVQC